MSTLDCRHEDEVVGAVLSGRWPQGCDETLHEHVSACPVCSEVTAVVELLREDHSATFGDVHVPAAGQVWWRAAVRARLEAVHTAARPITWMQGLAAAAVAGLAIVLFGMVWPFVVDGASQVTGMFASINPGATEVGSRVAVALQQALPWLLIAAAFVIVTPIAVYFALSDKN
jgi:hypothetical protein